MLQLFFCLPPCRNCGLGPAGADLHPGVFAAVVSVPTERLLRHQRDGRWGRLWRRRRDFGHFRHGAAKQWASESQRGGVGRRGWGEKRHGPKKGFRWKGRIFFYRSFICWPKSEKPFCLCYVLINIQYFFLKTLFFLFLIIFFISKEQSNHTFSNFVKSRKGVVARN